MLAENRYGERKINARNATVTAKQTHLNLGKILTKKKKVASNNVCTYYMIKMVNSSVRNQEDTVCSNIVTIYELVNQERNF